MYAYNPHLTITFKWQVGTKLNLAWQRECGIEHNTYGTIEGFYLHRRNGEGELLIPVRASNIQAFSIEPIPMLFT